MLPAYSKLIGTPYSDLDCWGVAREFYRLVFGIELKRYFEGETPSRDTTENLIFSNRGDFLEVEKPRFGDIILIKLLGIECHIAIYLDATSILHTQNKVGCMIDRFSRWEKRTSGFYRIAND